MRRLWPFAWPAVLVLALALAALAACSSLGAPRIEAVSPAEGAGDVPITAPIRLSFSKPMDRASVEAHFRLEPEVDGRLVWAGTEARFRPRVALAPGTTYTARLEAGVLSQAGDELEAERTWRFRTRVPRSLYLGRVDPESEARQIYVAPLDGGAPRQLTDHAPGVWDYAVHPQGEAIVYSVLRKDGGADLWRMDRDGANQRQLLACPEAACVNPAWSPEGGLIAYERRDIWREAPNLDPEASRIWFFDLEKNEERPLFDYDVPAHSPVWGPAGGQLAYVSPALPGVEVYDLGTGALQQFGNDWGAAPTWSPEGNRLVVPDLLLLGGPDPDAPEGEAGDHEDEFLAVRLVRIDLAAETLLDLSGPDDFVKDTAPAWSPGGGWIALARQFLDEARWTPGRQIWLTRPDASEAYELLNAPMADHFGFAWRPDGGALAYLRADLSEGPQLVPDVSVWYFDFLSGEAVFVAEGGVLPRWLP